MATRGARGRRASPDEDEEAPAPRAAARAATPVAAAGGAAAAPARAARTPAPTPGAADADPENITPEFLSDFNAKKGEIERVTASVKCVNFCHVIRTAGILPNTPRRSSTGLIVSYTQQLQQTSDPGEVASEGCNFVVAPFLRRHPSPPSSPRLLEAARSRGEGCLWQRRQGCEIGPRGGAAALRRPRSSPPPPQARSS